MSDAGDKPRSTACERNREPILEVLREALAGCRHVLEIGSGTGQHAVHFAAAMPELTWQCSDRDENLPGIRRWLDEAGLANTPTPLALDVMQDEWPQGPFDAVFSANTLHIMAWAEVERMFARLPASTTPAARLVIYGPFNIDGAFTSPSNAEFDRHLKTRAPHMGIRDRAAVDALAAQAGFRRVADHAMPANNRCLVWQRS